MGSALYQSRWEIRINMTNGPELQVVESARRINYHLPPASRMVIPSHCLICDGQRVFATAAVRPITNHTWEAFGQYIQCFKFGVILRLFVPLIIFSGWVKSLLLGTQEQRMDCEHPRCTFYFIFILFCDDFIIPLCLSFPQNCPPPQPFSFFSIFFFGLPIYRVQLHGSDLMPGLGLRSSEQQRTPRLLDFIDNINPLPSLWENELSVGGFLFFSRKGC